MAEKTGSSSVSTLEYNTIDLPPSIEIKESSIRMGEVGAFAKEDIPENTRFGPYKGEIIDASIKKYIDYRFAWEIYEPNSDDLRHTVCAMDSKLSNWMRHVNCARFYEEQNILSVQEDFSIFYVAMKDIKAGEELLTWFDPKLLKRTKRRLSKMARKPVGYTIELVPWSDEKKFVPEIIDTKRARKKKVLSDMISLDENPLAITRTLQSLPKLPCTPRQLAQSATYRQLYASLIAEADSGPRVDKRKSTKQDNSGKKTMSTPADVFTKQKKNNSKSASIGVKNPASSAAQKDVKNSVGASSNNKLSDTIKKSSSNVDFKAFKMVKSEDLDIKVNVPKPKSRKKITKDYYTSMCEEVVPKPIIYKTNDDGSVLVEDHDENFLLKNIELRPECDDQCTCLDKQQAMLDQNIKTEKEADFVIHFTLLPEHKTVGPDKKILYRCDICGNAYNHAFTLKRHYLGIHINHRYLTASDVQSCQIETFHIGTQLEICTPNYPKPPSNSTDSNLIDICIKKEMPSVPSLSQLAKLALVDTDNTQPSDAASSSALDNSNCTLSSNTKTAEQTVKEKDNSFIKETQSLCNNDLVCNSDDQMRKSDIETLTDCQPGSDPKLEAYRDNESCVGLAKSCKEEGVTNECHNVNNIDYGSESCIKACDNVRDTLSTIPVVSGGDDTLNSPSDISTAPESTSDSDSNKVLHQNLASNITQKLSPSHIPVECDMGTLHGSSNDPSITRSSTELQKEESRTDILEVLTQSCEEKTSTTQESIVTEEGDIENKNVNVPDGPSKQNAELDVSKDNDAFIESEHTQLPVTHTEPSVGQPDIIDETQISASFVTDDKLDNIQALSDIVETTQSVSLSGDSLVPCETSLLENSKNAQPEIVNCQNVFLPTVPVATSLISSPCTVVTSLSEPINPSDSIHSPASSGKLTITEKTSPVPSSSAGLTESIVIPFAALQNETSTSITMISPTKSVSKMSSAKSSASTASATKSSETAVTVSSKNSSPPAPQVIFVTNIVFPLVTPSHKTLPTSGQSPTTTGQAVTSSGGISKPLPLGSPTAGVPLVLISPLPAGMSSANAFLQSSTALKTIQSLQNSLNVMSIGNTSTVLTGSKGNLPNVFPSSGIKSHDAAQSKVALAARQTGSGSKMATSTSHKSTPVQAPSNSHDCASQPEDLYRCHMCVLVFKTMSQLKNHIRNDPHRFKGSFKQYGCSQCTMRFSTKANLLRHNLMSHQEDENHSFRCSTCGKGFSTENYLKMHARFHLGKNFPCKHGCKDLFFPNAGSLVKHLRAYHHSDQEPKDYSKKVKEEEMKISKVKASDDKLKAAHNSQAMTISKNPIPYSMTQPGIGFQAKRVKSKSCREETELSIKTEPQTDDEKSNDSKGTNGEENSSQELNKLLFKCKLCQNGFSTHLKLLQHRTQKHGASQSVQEYLYQMSKDIYEDDPSDLDSMSNDEFSPPPSPKTFFSNVNRKGYENMQHFIEGGVESLKNWRKYLKVKDYISLSETELPVDNTDCKYEWTFYNFPPSFVYKCDCTEFYNEENRAPEIKSDKGSPVQKCLDSSDVSVSDVPTTMSTTDVTVKTEVEDNKYGVMSQERCNYIINKLEQHLQTTLENESSDVIVPDTSDVTTNTSAGSGVNPIEIKTEVEDNDYGVMIQGENKNDSSHTAALNEQLSSQEQNILTVAEPSKQSQILDIVNCNVVENQGTGDIVVDFMTTKELEEEKLTCSRMDSGLGSMSSRESPASESETATRDSMDESIPTSLSDKKQSDESNVASRCVSEKKIFTELLQQEKLDALKSSLIQSINLESSQGGILNKGLSSLKPSREINALNLHITGSQLLSSKMSQVIEKYISSDLLPFMETKRQRTLSLPSMGFLSPTKLITMDESLNISDASKHDHKRYSILWSGQMHHKVLKEAGESTFCCPVVETVRKQESLRLKEQYLYEKASRDRELDGKVKKHDLEKVTFAKEMGLMERKEFEMSHHAKKLEEHIIKPPEIWRNYENIWFGKKGTVAVVCSICHRHFSYWDLCLRHQLKKHPHIEPASIEMERDNDVEDLYYYYPMRYGILAQTQLIPDNLPPLEVYVCTRCGFPFKNLNKLHSHVITCDPAREATTYSGSMNLSNTKKKLLPMMDRRLTQELETTSAKNKLSKNSKPNSSTSDKHKKSVLSSSQSQVGPKLSSKAKISDKNSSSFSSYFSLDASSKQKNYDLLYNPQNHTRRRESYKVLDQHQCHGCNLKFNSLSFLERHVRKCSGRDKLLSQKPVVSQIIPDDAAVRKQHTCRYCNKRFTYIKGVDLHYKRICAVRKVKEEENQLTGEDLAHEEELKRIIEHLRWSKTLNKDSSDIIQGHVRVEEDGSLTRVVKDGVKKNVKGGPKLNSSKEDDLSLSSSIPNSSKNVSLSDDKSVMELGLSGCYDKPGRRLTRSSSLEKVSPIYETSGKRKLPSTNKAKSAENERKKSKKSKKDKGSRNKSANRTCKANQAVNPKRPSSDRTVSREDNQARLPVRKRGRPQKFDPSDMESSYKKKKKIETSQSGKASPRSNFESPKLSTKSSNAQKGGKTTEVSKKNQIKSPSVTNKAPKKELSAAESSKLMEKMKQLKEAAKLENDNQIKLKKAKQAKKIAGKKVSKSETDLSLNTDNKSNKQVAKSQPSELFKQLTKDETKTISVKKVSPNQPEDKCNKTESNPSSSNISTLKNLKRKNSDITPCTSPPKKLSSSVSTAPSGPSNQDSSKVSTTTCDSKISTLPNTKIADKKAEADVSLSESPKSLPCTLSLKVSTLPSKSTSVPGSGTEVSSTPTSKSQPVSVRVVTLSPNGMNLLTFDSPSDVPVKTTSASCSSTRTYEVSSVVPNKILKTSSHETVHYIRKVPDSKLGTCDLKAQDNSKTPVTNIVISNTGQVIQAPMTTTCIKVKRQPSQGTILKTDDVTNFILANDISTTENPVIMPVVVSAAVQDKVHNPATSTTFMTLAKHQGYSVLKTSVGSVQLSASGSSITSNQNSINSQGQNVVKLTSPVQKCKLSGEPDSLKLSGLIKPGHTVKLGSRSLVSTVGDKIHLINPPLLMTPTSIVLSSGSNTNSSIIVPGTVSNLIVTPSSVKSSQTNSPLPTLVTGTRLKTPPSRFTTPQTTVIPNIIHGNVIPSGPRVLKIGNTIPIEANSQIIKNKAGPNVRTNIPEKSVVIGAVSVPRNPGPRTHPRPTLVPQGVSSGPRQQIITLNANRFSSGSQPTFLVQHSSSPKVHQVGNTQFNTNIVTKSSSPSVVTTLRTPSSKNLVNERTKQTANKALNSLLTNQIMISLDDGTTAMLDPDSLAQLLSLSPPLNKGDLSSELTNIVTDPEHVMVNMAEIQPSSVQQSSDEISWPANGSVDLTELPDSLCDL